MVSNVDNFIRENVRDLVDHNSNLKIKYMELKDKVDEINNDLHMSSAQQPNDYCMEPSCQSVNTNVTQEF